MTATSAAPSRSTLPDASPADWLDDHGPVRRALVAVLHTIVFGSLVALFAWWITRPAERPTDFEFWWRATDLLLAGRDPYAMRPRTPSWPLPDRLFYPGPALVISVPFALVPLRAAFVLWSGVGGGVLAWALRRDGRSVLPVLLSVPFLWAIRLGQWSPLLAAATLVPALGCLLAAKPTLGAALFGARPTRTAFVSGLIVVAVSLAWLPTWPRDWLVNVRYVVGHPAPIATPLGSVVVLAALRWRRREARLLLLYACVPQLLLFADQLPVLLVARERVEALVLWGTSWIGFAYWFLPLPAWTSTTPWSAGPYVVISVYWVALGVVLRRPNVGAVPPRVEALLDHLRVPGWLRGTPPSGSAR
jgi:hypothetical protein